MIVLIHCVDNTFYPTLDWECDYLSMPELKFIHIRKMNQEELIVSHRLEIWQVVWQDDWIVMVSRCYEVLQQKSYHSLMREGGKPRAPSQYKGPFSWHRYKDETVVRQSDLNNGNTYTGKPISLYWDSPGSLNATIIPHFPGVAVSVRR